MNAKLPTTRISRREMMTKLGLSLCGGALVGRGFAGESDASSRWQLGCFTKPFQDVGFEQTADMVAEGGWVGIECPLRKAGQILPERVEDDLPKLVSALAKRNLQVLTMATDIKDLEDPLSERVLRTAAKLGIKRYRLAHLQYDLSQPIEQQMNRIKGGLRQLIAMNGELGMCAAFENHSGRTSFGAPIWDLYEIMRDEDPRRCGICFDVGHARVEGGLDWEIQFRLVERYLTAIYVKDFSWVQDQNGWKEDWVPLGKGMVNSTFVPVLLRSSFRGPIIQHFEFSLGEGKARMAAMKKDRELLSSWLNRGA
jgi:sugar phosphate isomerase/epimerase